MSYYNVKNKKNGKEWPQDEEEVARIKALKITQRYEITEVQPMKQIQSPFVVKIEKVDKTTKNKK